MPPPPKLPLDQKLFRPGERVAIAVSAGADSVALLRSMLTAAEKIGLVLSIIHVHHNLRGPDADADASFVRELASTHKLPLELAHVDTPARISATGESTEQAARHLRYEVFNRLLNSGEIDAVATAHTLDDQAETVLMKFLRGAWTEGLSGIHPILRIPKTGQTEGRILRPLLNTRRAEVEAYLHALNQPWREDVTNADIAFTRNRIRHELLPLLRRDFNPALDSQLAHMAALARDEEARWQSELIRLLPTLLLTGTATRGGGRSTALTSEKSVSLEIPRLRALDPALRRRILRAAAQTIGAHLDFNETESLLDLCLGEQSRAGAKRTLAALIAERTPRELRLTSTGEAEGKRAGEFVTYTLPIPGQIEAFGLTFTATAHTHTDQSTEPAQIRPWQPGDRVTLAHSSGPKKVKEVLTHMHITGKERALWPVAVWRGEILWLRNAELASAANRPTITAHPVT